MIIPDITQEILAETGSKLKYKNWTLNCEFINRLWGRNIVPHMSLYCYL